MKRIIIAFILISQYAVGQTVLMGKQGGTGIANIGKTLKFGDTIQSNSSSYSHSIIFPNSSKTNWMPDTSDRLALFHYTIPRSGTISNYPLYGPIQFSTGTTALWQNSSTGTGYYIGFAASPSDISSGIGSISSSFYGPGSVFSTVQSIDGVTNTSINLSTSNIQSQATNSLGLGANQYIYPNKIEAQASNTLFEGYKYESTTHGYVNSNQNQYTILDRGLGDARWAPITGGAYLSSTLNAGKIYVGNGSNVGTAVTPSLSATPGTFSLATTGAFTFPDAATGTRGLLNSTDWNTFNNKQAALSGTGFVYQSGSTTSYSATIPNSALTNSTFTVNGTGMALGTSSTITAAAGTLTGTTLNSTVVSSSLTSVGTVTAGTWNATAIPIIYGGTNNTSTLTTYGQDYFNGTKITNGILNRYDSAQTVILNSPNSGSGRNEPSYNPPLLELVNNAANNNEGRQHLNFKTYGTTPGIINDIHFYRYGGTETSPTATPAGSISSFGWRGKGTTALSQSTAAFVVRALNLWTDSDEGTEIRFECNKTGTTWAGRRQIMTMGGYATNMSLTSDGAYSPYRTTGCLTIDMVTPNVSASTIPILIPHSTSFSGGMVMGSSVSDESYIFHYGSAVAGNLYGSVATGKTLRIMGNTGNAVVDGLSVGITPNSGTLGGITAMTSGVRIGTQANMGTAATGYLTVDGGTAALPSLVVGSQTSYTGTTDGSITNDATQKCFVKYVGSTKKYDVSAVYTQTAAITVASTTVATSVLTSTVSAGDLAAAKEIRIKLVGFHSAVSNPNITITVTLNGTTVLTTGAIASGNSTNAYAEINALVTIRTTGVSGTVSGQGLYQEDGGGVANVYAPMVNTSTVTVNTTTPTIDVQAQWGTSSASNTITFTDGYIEIIK